MGMVPKSSEQSIDSIFVPSSSVTIKRESLISLSNLKNLNTLTRHRGSLIHYYSDNKFRLLKEIALELITKGDSILTLRATCSKSGDSLSKDEMVKQLLRLNKLAHTYREKQRNVSLFLLPFVLSHLAGNIEKAGSLIWKPSLIYSILRDRPDVLGTNPS